MVHHLPARNHSSAESADAEVERDRHVWFFNCANTFSGNPKWLFLYVNHHRPDIDAYWVADDPATVALVRRLGFQAFTFADPLGVDVQERAGVFVVNQVKERIPKHLDGATLLNLWHGVGVKGIERRLRTGHFRSRVAAKYIRNNQYYRDHQLFLVPSATMEEHFVKNVGLDEEIIVRAGYPQNLYPRQCAIATFDHDLRRRQGLPASTRIAAWFPTHRDDEPADFFRRALPDIPRLLRTLEAADLLLIVKPHPSQESDPLYQRIRTTYADEPRLLFWDIADDVYEVFSQIDVAVVDYSSIYYDLLEAGVTRFVRYVHDLAEGTAIAESDLDYLEMTTGPVCDTFDTLLTTLGGEVSPDLPAIGRLRDVFWSYAADPGSEVDDLERIVEAALAFEGRHVSLPTLHSYDVFDTLVHRRTVLPVGVFEAVRERIERSPGRFSHHLTRRYVEIRQESERAAREHRRKQPELRDSKQLEIQFRDIFDRMRAVHGLTDDQVDSLMAWEIEAERASMFPDAELIADLKGHLEDGDDVVLISDMYLPREVVTDILAAADPVLADIPLYLSSELGVQKTTKELFLRVYENGAYDYAAWVHHGDNRRADVEIPRSLGIIAEPVPPSTFSRFEMGVARSIDSYDGYQLAGLLREFRMAEFRPAPERLSWNHISAYLVPYVDWVLDDAVRRGYRTLYFVSRDGFHLKRIADAIVSTRGLDLQTRYLHGSRLAWRLPSQREGIDPDTFAPHGELASITTPEHLLSNARLSADAFAEMVPEFEGALSQPRISPETRQALVAALAATDRFREHLLKASREENELAVRYLRQEMDLDEAFAIVEYWGRGYTQDCLTRLLADAAGHPVDNPCYYARSINPTDGRSIRHNFTIRGYSMLFVEAIFANHPSTTVSGYRLVGDRVEPIVDAREHDSELFEAMSSLLPEFARRYAAIEFHDRDGLRREHFRYGFEYFSQHPTARIFLETIAHLRDAVELGVPESEFAPALTAADLELVRRGELDFRTRTRSLPMSLARTDAKLRAAYTEWSASQASPFAASTATRPTIYRRLIGRVSRAAKVLLNG